MDYSVEAHRATAADWHGGQTSALYAFASSGTVTRGISGEIRSNLRTVERGSRQGYGGAPEVARLNALLSYCEHREMRLVWQEEEAERAEARRWAEADRAMVEDLERGGYL